MTTPEREARLEAFLVGDLEDAIEATMLAASSDHLTPDMWQYVNRALVLLQITLGQQLGGECMKDKLTNQELNLIEGTRRVVSAHQQLNINLCQRLLIGAMISVPPDQPWQASALADHMGHPRTTVRRRLSELVEMGLASNLEGGMALNEKGRSLFMQINRQTSQIVLGLQVGYSNDLLEELVNLPAPLTGTLFCIGEQARTIQFPPFKGWYRTD